MMLRDAGFWLLMKLNSQFFITLNNFSRFAEKLEECFSFRFSLIFQSQKNREKISFDFMKNSL